jgi:hypothetical protein
MSNFSSTGDPAQADQIVRPVKATLMRMQTRDMQ